MAGQPIKIYGLHRTGTNLAAYLLRANFAVNVLNDARTTGWKHGRMPADIWTRDAKFVLCVRHPLAQAYSNWRYYQRSYDFDSTMPGRFRPDTTFAEFLDQPIYEFNEPFNRFNVLYRHWIDCLPADRRVIIRQEDQSHQDWALANVQRKLGLERTSANWVTTAEHIDVGQKPRGIIEQPTDYLSAYTPQMLDMFKARIDQKLLERFGYPIVPPASGTAPAERPKAESISFIIITNGQRADLTKLCLASVKRNFEASTFKGEIIISGNTEPFTGIEGVKLVDAKDAAGAGLLGAMRNAGAAQATGDVLAFLDDDILLPPFWLRQLLGFRDGWDLLGVRLIAPDGSRMYEPRSFVTGGTAIVRCALFDKVKWDPSIPFHAYRDGKGPNEDCDYTQRVRQSGFAVAFDPINFAWHCQGESQTCPALEELKATTRAVA